MTRNTFADLTEGMDKQQTSFLRSLFTSGATRFNPIGSGPLLSGQVEAVYVRCGKPNCRCHAAREHRHGPYHYWRTFENGKRHRRYIPPSLVSVVTQLMQSSRQDKQTIIAERRHFESVLRGMKSTLRELRKATP